MHSFDTINNYFSNLTKQQFMNLVTYRKSGEGVGTPVWFAQDGNRLFVRTASIAWKVKRIRKNPRVQVAPSDMRGKALGAAVDGKARILSGEECKTADKLLGAKYGLMYKAMRLRVRGNGNEGVFIEITPPTVDG